MSIFGFIIFLLFIFIIWPIVHVAGAISKARRQFYDRQEAFRQAYGANNQNNNSRQNQPHKGKRKIFSRNDGEYVEFEEVTTASSYTETKKNGYGEERYTVEQQVTDAEWEDIK